MPLMIDIETLGTGQGAAVVQLGAVLFDPETYVVIDTFQQYIRPDRAASIDVDTVLWWIDGDPAAQAALIEGMSLAIPEDELVPLLTEWVPDGVERVYAQGQDFDFPHLGALAVRQGIEMPWKFYAHRDTRTVFDEHNYDYRARRPEILAELGAEHVRHEAVTDCLVQVKMLAEARSNG